MDHLTSKEYISELLDNELPSEFLQPLFEHLSGCAECRAFYTRTRTMQRSMQQLPESEPSETVNEKFNVLAMGTTKQSFRNRKISISVPSVLYSACAIIVIGLFMLAVGSYQEQAMGAQYRQTISATQQHNSNFINRD